MTMKQLKEKKKFEIMAQKWAKALEEKHEQSKNEEFKGWLER